MNKVALLLISAVFGGCVSIPDSPDELVRTTKTTETFCYTDDASLVETRVKTYLSTCYKPVEGSTMLPAGDGYISMPLKMEFFVIEDEIPSGKRYSVGSSQGYAFSADVIGAKDSCNTKLDLYAITGFWRKAFIQTDLAARGLDAECTF